MDDEVIINLVEVVGDSICVTDRDGNKVYEIINHALSDKKKIIISFDGVTDLTSAFLNNAIGQLYGNFDENLIKANMSVTEISKNDVFLLKMVVGRAKSFFADSDHCRKVVAEVLGDGSDN